jgi:uncharacterized protein YndB with AHSA1/START domain
MNPNLQFDFAVDKEKNTISVKREFAANRQLVWDCYTKSELLEQWFAPKPFGAETKSMDFKEGGHWHYAMVSPEGQKHWGYTTYKTIKPIDYYTTEDGFADETGAISSQLPSATWKVEFEDLEKNTLVQTVITYGSLKDLETVIKMGMKEGYTATLKQLDELLLKANV